MKHLLLIVVCSSTVLFSCTKDRNLQPPEEDVKTLHELVTISGETKIKFLELAPTVNGNPKVALMQTLDWVQQQEGVASAFHIDSTYIEIEMTSGLVSTFFFNEINEDGFSVARGGGGGGVLKNLTAGGSNCSNEIENKDVFIFAPAASEFYTQAEFDLIFNRLNNSEPINSVIPFFDGFLSLQQVDRFPDFGLVIMNTHGLPNGFMIADYFNIFQYDPPADFVEFRDLVINQLTEEYFNKIMVGKLRIAAVATYNPFDISWWSSNLQELETGKFRLFATSKYLDDIGSLENTIVFGNFCYSGWTAVTPEFQRPIGKAFIDKGARAYYGYQMITGRSEVVDNGFAKAMEDSLTRSFVVEIDSTGNAHLGNNGQQFSDPSRPDLFFIQAGQENWCYGGCQDTMVDARDGTVYQTVCIGNQVWMAENLKYDIGYNWCYENNPSMCDNFGRLYDWETALVACPTGWHLPSEAEFQELIDALGGNSVAGGKLKATTGWSTPNTGATNSSGFSALGGGGRDESGFYANGETAWFWSTDLNGTWVRKLRLINSSEEALMVNWVQQEFDPAHSCRCIKD